MKHTGQNSGAGTVKWDAQQSARFDEKVKGTLTFALQVLDFLKKEETVDESLKQKLGQIKSSSFQRLLTDPTFRNAAGLEVKEGKIKAKYSSSEVAKPLVKVAKDLLRDDFNVKNCYKFAVFDR